VRGILGFRAWDNPHSFVVKSPHLERHEHFTVRRELSLIGRINAARPKIGYQINGHALFRVVRFGRCGERALAYLPLSIIATMKPRRWHTANHDFIVG